MKMSTTKKFKFSNGDKVKEKVTGFQGVITGTCFYITGCNQYLIIPKSKNVNTKSEGSWYDEGRLELMQAESIKVDEVKATNNGCDLQAPNKG